MTGRAAIVQAIERAGIVAVIRIKETDKLRAVVDAIAEGGVRALEVTMTVPNAVELIRVLAPALPPGFLLGAGTVLDPATALTRDRRRRAVHRQSGFPRAGHPRVRGRATSR